MRSPRPTGVPGMARPQLQGPGVLRRRYVRRAPGAAPEFLPPGAKVRAAVPEPAAAEAPVPARAGLLSSGKLVWLFLCLLFLCQLALLVPAIAPLRMVVRITAFGASLTLLALVRGPALKHPALPFILGAMGVTTLNFFHPSTSGALAGLAQLGIQLSIMAPLLWVTRLSIDGATFRRTLTLIFLFNVASASVGVLQVYFPGRFQPEVSMMVLGHGEGYLRSLEFETSSGERVLRPMGLTDMPGGASAGGFYSVLLGSGFLLSSRRGLVRALSLGGIVIGLLCLYLCQVRATFVMLGVCVLAMAGVLALSGRMMRFLTLLAVVGVAAVGAFSWAVAVGGDAVLARWATLVEGSPEDVYQKNRGGFVERTFEFLLPEYPLGAGLGRYGMANAYFGDNSDPERPPLWAEVQWTAWVFDGGYLCVLLYPLGLLASMWWVFRVATRRDDSKDEFWLWGSVIFAYNLGAVALTFSYPLFLSQTGMEFWLLNAALFGAMAHAKNVHAHLR